MAISELQRQVGNRAVCDLLDLAQPKLDVGSAADPYEAEADRVAREVVGALQQEDSGQSAGHVADDEAQVSRTIVRRTAVVGAEGGVLDQESESAIQSARGSGAPLDPDTRERMENAFGVDLGFVRVHSGPASRDLNERVQARAFTVGGDIFFRDSVPDAQTRPGQELLAHELTHTIQQRKS
jgi:hypothetical protein